MKILLSVVCASVAALASLSAHADPQADWTKIKATASYVCEDTHGDGGLALNVSEKKAYVGEFDGANGQVQKILEIPLTSITQTPATCAKCFDVKGTVTTVIGDTTISSPIAFTTTEKNFTMVNSGDTQTVNCK